MRTEANKIGCSIFDVDANTLADSEMDAVKDLLYRNRLIVLKDQNLDEAAYCEFAQALGNPVPYLQDNYHHPEFPLIFVSSNVKKEGKQIGVARTGGYWHSDTSFEQDPKFITMLMPKVLPKNFARITRFIDMAGRLRGPAADDQGQARRSRVPAHRQMRYKVRAQDAGYDIFEILAASSISAARPCAIRR